MSSLVSKGQKNTQSAANKLANDYNIQQKNAVDPMNVEENIINKFSRGGNLGSVVQGTELFGSNVDILEKQVKIEFNGSLTDFAENKAISTFQIPEDNFTIFQKQIRNSRGIKEDLGDITKAIIIECSACKIQSDLPFDTCINISDIPGNIFFQSGKSALISIPQSSYPTPTLENVYKIDASSLQPAQLQLASISLESLKNDYGALPFNKKDFGVDGKKSILQNACLVRVDSPITKVISASHKTTGLDLSKIPIIEIDQTSFYPLNRELVELCVEDIMEKVNNINVPWTNLCKMKATLEREDGQAWSNIISHPKISKNLVSEELKKHVINKHYSVSCILCLKYAIPSETF